jgi:hypothetical protein
MKFDKIHLFLIFTQVACIALLVLIFINQHTCLFCKLFSSTPSRSTISTRSPTCEKHKCGAIDDVNNPAYNVRESIKQTLLLEQHLAEKAKYCKSCILKHYNLNIGLMEESIWMAGNHCKDYPKLQESLNFFKKQFDKWYKNMDDEQTRLDSLTQLREWRREMVDLYYFNSKKPDGQS